MTTPLAMVAQRISGSPQERIIRHVREDIRTGRLRPGDQLEAREEYIQAFSVNPLTVQRAFARLLRDGFVVTRNRIGTFVAPRPPNIFNVAVVFDMIKADAMTARFYRDLALLVPDWTLEAERTLIPYYGLRGPDDGGDRERLADDLDNDRLAAVFWVCGPTAIPPDPRFHLPWIPSVFIHAHVPPNASYPCLRTESFFPRAIEEAARCGLRRPAVLLLTNGSRPTEETRTQLLADFQRCGLDFRPHWMHAATWENPFWAGQMMETLFRLPRAERPDSLIVADDNLLSEALAGLTRAGALKSTRLLAHTNFPLRDPLPFPAIRIGIDCREVLRRGLETLARLRQGAPLPLIPPTITMRLENSLPV